MAPNDEGDRYETLEGHVEQGESTFTVEETEGKIICKIETHSRPGIAAARIVAPVITLPYQAFCTRKALENVKAQLQQ